MGKTRPRAAKLVHLISLSIELIALYDVYMHSLPYLVNKTGVRAIRHLYTCTVFFVSIHVQPRCSDEIFLQLAFLAFLKLLIGKLKVFFHIFESSLFLQ